MFREIAYSGKNNMAKQSIGKKKLSLSLLIKIIKDTGQGFIDDSVTRLSGSLAYATLFSIIPFLSLLVTIGVALHIDLADQLYMQLKPIVGAEVVGELRLIIENAERTDFPHQRLLLVWEFPYLVLLPFLQRYKVP